jgi:membrane protease subunit HflC
MNENDLKHIIEATLLAAGRPVPTQQLLDLFDERERPSIEQMQAALSLLAADYAERGIELVEVGISNIEFVPQVRLAAFERQKAFMQSIAAGYSNAGLQRKQEILNRTNAEVERLLGEGEQQSRILRGQADADNIAKTAAAIKETGDFYEFQRTLEMYQEALQGKTRLILTTDSDLLRLLKSFETTREAAPQPTAISRE